MQRKVKGALLFASLACFRSYFTFLDALPQTRQVGNNPALHCHLAAGHIQVTLPEQAMLHNGIRIVSLHAAAIGECEQNYLGLSRILFSNEAKSEHHMKSGRVLPSGACQPQPVFRDQLQ